MNPVLASSLIQVGKSLVDRISGPAPVSFKEGDKPFSVELQQELTSSSKVESSTSALRQNLLRDPQIKSFMEQNSDCEIYFQKRADGSSQILSSSGAVLTIGKDSTTNQLIHQYFDQCMKEGICLSPHRPGSVLLEG